ncbi:SDR family oxidoreductase [Kordia sp.]|uniref:SDR family oxidoreductase n=1 Tax=Kordia sp. TaxID=1965332 RepID=UPI003B591033
MSTTKKVALITGANKGIGFETAKTLLEKGYIVILGVRDEKKGQHAVHQLQNVNARYVVIDVTDEKSISLAEQYIHDNFGKLDVLVNNAGIWIDFGVPMLEVSIKDIETTLKVNTVGVIAVIKEFIPLLKKSESGNIINVSSGLASLNQNSDPTYEYYDYKSLAYSTSKSALNMVTILFSYELKAANIKVNAADPGYCATDLNGKTGPRTPQQGSKIIVKLATLPSNGPTGGFFDENDKIEW